MGKHIDAEARKLSTFLEVVWEKKLWVLCTLVFLFTLNFVVRTYAELPERFIRNIQQAEMNQLAMRESDSITEIIEIVRGLIPKYQPLFTIYDEYYGGKAMDHQPPEEVTKQIAALCMQLRLEAAKYIGSIRGMRFANPDFAQFRDNILESLQDMDALVVRFEEFSRVAQQGSMDAKRDAAQKLAVDFNYTMARFTSAIRTSGNLATSGIRQKTHEMELLGAELKWLSVKFYLTIPSLVYVALYIVFVCRAYLRSRWIKSPIPVRKRRAK